MSKRKVNLVIYCEDKQQECFARKFLYGMGWTKNDIRIPPYPIGRGSGEQWVREAYIKELALYHRKLRTYAMIAITAVSYTHLRAHETPEHLVCRLLLEKKKETID